MNLHNPTVPDLKRLVAGVDHDATAHVVWVDVDGDVHIDPVRGSPWGYENRITDRCRVRLTTAFPDERVAGPEVAADDRRVRELFHDLIVAWTEGERGHVDD